MLRIIKSDLVHHDTSATSVISRAARVLTLNSSLGKKQAQLNGETPEGLAQILLAELAMERD